MFTRIYALVRLVMLRAATRQNVEVDRFSFVDALRLLREVANGHHAMLFDLVVNPKRSGRIEPRVVKRRRKEYPRMTQPRQELRKMLILQRIANQAMVFKNVPFSRTSPRGPYVSAASPNGILCCRLV